VGVLIAFPGLVTGSLDKVESVDLRQVGDQMRESLQPSSEEGGYGSDQGAEPAPAPRAPAPAGSDAAPSAPAAAPEPAAEEDPMKAMQDALKPKPGQ
jgi:hypothetical protein